MRIRSQTVSIEVDVDLRDFSVEDLRDELESRGAMMMSRLPLTEVVDDIANRVDTDAAWRQLTPALIAALEEWCATRVKTEVDLAKWVASCQGLDVAAPA